MEQLVQNIGHAKREIPMIAGSSAGRRFTHENGRLPICASSIRGNCRHPRHGHPCGMYSCCVPYTPGYGLLPT